KTQKEYRRIHRQPSKTPVRLAFWRLLQGHGASVQATAPLDFSDIVVAFVSLALYKRKEAPRIPIRPAPRLPPSLVIQRAAIPALHCPQSVALPAGGPAPLSAARSKKARVSAAHEHRPRRLRSRPRSRPAARRGSQRPAPADAAGSRGQGATRPLAPVGSAPGPAAGSGRAAPRRAQPPLRAARWAQ